MMTWSIIGAIFAVVGIPVVILVFDLWTKAAEKGKKSPEAVPKLEAEEKPEAGQTGS